MARYVEDKIYFIVFSLCVMDLTYSDIVLYIFRHLFNEKD